MAGLITAQTTVREAVTRYPGAEKIFDKYGLTGCGGAEGPVEPVGFFAAVHHVDPAELIRELDEYASSLAAPAAHGHGAMDATAAQPYRLFVTTALAITLFAGISSGIASAMTGGGWGALRGEAWLAMVQTHGHMQLFGFLGLFVMGMAYHILPRFKALPPPGRGVVLATYWLMTAGVVLRASAQPHGQGFVRWMLGASAPLELAGAVLFAGVIGRLFWQARARSEPFDRFIIAALAWFVVVSAMNAYLVIDAAIAGERVLNLAGDAALREAAVNGFIVMFVVGVSLRVLPFFLSLQPSYARLRDASFAVLLVAAPVHFAADWAPQFGRYGWTDGAASVSTFALALGVVGVVAALRIFEAAAPGAPRVGAPPAYGAMVRVAYAWLIAGVALDVYWRLRETEGGFTPMYAEGAIRHSFLLGFATLMMMAMAYRTVPVFSGRELRWPALVPASFALVGVAAVLRVFPFALTTAPSKLDFKLVTASGFLLFLGLAAFAAEIVPLMFGHRAAAAAAPDTIEPVEAAAPPAERELRVPTGGPPPGVLERPAPPAGASGPIRRDMIVADALRLSPLVLQVLLDYGFGPLADPDLRARMAPTITIERAAAFVGADPQSLVDTLNLAVSQTRALSADGSTPIDFKLIETAVTEDALLAALKTCNDPEIPVNIVDLGLVYGVTVRDAYAHLTMTLTASECPLADEVEDDVRTALLKVPGVETVDIDIVKAPAWSPDRMSATARAAVGW